MSGLVRDKEGRRILLDTWEEEKRKGGVTGCGAQGGGGLAVREVQGGGGHRDVKETWEEHKLSS